MKAKDKYLLIIGGYDPSGGAGVLVDKAVANKYRIKHFVIPTSITIQDHFQFLKSSALSVDLIKDYVNFFFKFREPSAVKIGLLGNDDVCRLVKKIFTNKNVPIVFDPVVKSTSGGKLFEGKIESIKDISRISEIVTLSSSEVSYFTGREISSIEELKKVSLKLLKLLDTKLLLLKGGDVLISRRWVYDILAQDRKAIVLKSKRFPFNLRGSGCILSTSIACEISRGNSLSQAILNARRFVKKAFKNSLPLSNGKSFWAG